MCVGMLNPICACGDIHNYSESYTGDAQTMQEKLYLKIAREKAILHMQVLLSHRCYEYSEKQHNCKCDVLCNRPFNKKEINYQLFTF